MRGWSAIGLLAWLALVGIGPARSAPPAAPPAATPVCNVATYGATGDGRTVATRQIQAAIDDCARRGGGVVLIPAGRFVSGTLLFRSHITLKLDHGAVLAGSTDVADYLSAAQVGLGTTVGVDVAGEGQRAGLLVFRDVEDVAIVGPGRIDGQGSTFFDNTPHIAQDFDPAATRNPAGEDAALRDLRYGPIEVKASGRPGVLILFFRARGVLVRDVTIADSPNWTMVFQTVDRIVASGFTISNNPLLPNNDGVDCNICTNAQFSDFTINAGDDDFAISGSTDIAVANGSMTSRSAAIRLESTQRATFTNLTIDSNRGLAIFASRISLKPTDGVIFSNIVLRTRLIPGHWWGKAEPIYIAVQPCTAQPCREGVRNVVFDNILADAEAGAVLLGTPENPLDGVTLRDVRLRMLPPDPAFASAVGGNLDRRWTAATPAEGIVKADLPAILCRNANRTTLRDVEIVWEGRQPDYMTEAVGCDRFQDIVIDGLVERGAPPAAGRAAVALRDGADVRIERLRPAAGRPPVRLDAVTGARSLEGKSL